MTFCIYKIVELVKILLVPEYVFRLTALPRACLSLNKTYLYFNISYRGKHF